MKAFLLAGGFGTRLRPLTDHTPKCLAKIGGVPLLSYWLEVCGQAGITEVLLNVTGHRQRVLDFLQETPTPVSVTVVEEPVPLGNAGTVRTHRRFVAEEPTFAILYADNFTTVDLRPVLAFHRTHNGVLTVGLFRAPFPHQAGIVRLDERSTIVEFEEKPIEPASNLANAGIYLARPSLFDAIPDRAGVVDFGIDVLPWLAHRMFGYELRGILVDIGTPAGLTAAEAAWRGFQTAHPAS